jgi:conjugal transfer/entry exclusion protein
MIGGTTIMLKRYDIRAPLIATITLASLSLIGTTGSGGGLGGVVFDPTNFGKNTLTAAQTAQMADTELEQLMLNQMNSRALSGFNFRDGMNINDIANLRSAINNLYGALGDENSVIQNRYQQYAASNLSWTDYAAREQRLAADRKDRAEVAFIRERQAIDNVNQQTELVKQLQAKTASSTGQLQSMQNLNEHMNLIAQQNAMLLEHFSMAEINKQTKEVETQAVEARKAEKIDKITSSVVDKTMDQARQATGGR